MKKGMILYVTEGKEEMELRQTRPDLREQRELLGARAICLATSEEEIADGWWRLLVRGMQEISCVKASYDAVRERVETFGAPLRLCG